ncbi:MAG TPA: hypothetical protein VMU69_01215, partial [Bradyrhizobium sp.]|nr:hypothetical protein [Bradyrhizobium sp.]
RHRTHPSLPPAPGRPIRVEHEYKREGALAYLAAWDVHRATLFGRCECKTGISAVRAAGRAGHGPEAISFGQPGVLGRRQWLLASRPKGR